MSSVVSADGTPIGFTKTGSGPPLLLVHGMTADSLRWDTVLPALAEHYTVHAMDRRGRGSSGDATVHSMAREHEDVVAVLEAIGEPTYLFGHSYGGVCALGALLLTKRVRSFVAYEPYVPAVPATEPSPATLRYEALEAAGDRDALVETFLREIIHAKDRDIAIRRAHSSWERRVRSAHTIPREMRAAERFVFDPALFRDLDIPVGFLVGGDSPTFLKEATERLHAGFPGSKVVVLEKQQHIAMDTAPDLFVKQLRGLLER